MKQHLLTHIVNKYLTYNTSQIWWSLEILRHGPSFKVFSLNDIPPLYLIQCIKLYHIEIYTYSMNTKDSSFCFKKKSRSVLEWIMMLSIRPMLAAHQEVRSGLLCTHDSYYYVFHICLNEKILQSPFKAQLNLSRKEE